MVPQKNTISIKTIFETTVTAHPQSFPYAHCQVCGSFSQLRIRLIHIWLKLFKFLVLTFDRITRIVKQFPVVRFMSSFAIYIQTLFIKSICNSIGIVLLGHLQFIPRFAFQPSDDIFDYFWKSCSIKLTILHTLIDGNSGDAKFVTVGSGFMSWIRTLTVLQIKVVVTFYRLNLSALTSVVSPFPGPYINLTFVLFLWNTQTRSLKNDEINGVRL